MLFLLLSVLAATCQSECYGQEQLSVTKQANLNSANLYRFANYIKWNGKLGNLKEFRFGVLGESPVYGGLEKVTQIRPFLHKGTSKERAITLTRVDDAATAANLHILFVARSVDSATFSEISRHLDPNTLVVVESSHHYDMGASIMLFFQSGKPRFELNREVLSTKLVIVNAQLQALSRSHR